MPHSSLVLLTRVDGPVDRSSSANTLGLDDPFNGLRSVAFLGDDGIAAGTVRSSGVVDVQRYPFTEMLVVYSGNLSLTTTGQRLTLGTNDSAVIAYGTACHIEATADSVWAFCAATLPKGSTTPGLTRIDSRAVLQPSAAPDAQILIGPAPQCRALTAFEDASSPLRVGVWDSTPYQRGIRAHKVHELMTLLEGTVVLGLEDGSRLTVKPGDTVFVPLNTPCSWTSTQYVRKFYAVT